MIEQLLIMMGFGGITLLVLFTGTWLVQLKTKNAAIVDTIWSATFPFLAVVYMFFSDGYAPRKIIILSMVVIWGMRLAIYLLIRTMGHAEDARYTALREEWGSKQNILMLRFFYFQAILALVLSLPFALIMINDSPRLRIIEFIGAVLWLVAVTGETVADAQMKQFKTNPDNKGKVCNAGLWNYSRHPNYFFEWMIWVSYFLFALGSPWGIITIICPMAILYFLLKVTGIPYTETQILKSRGDAYRMYQKSTSAFIPLPKRN